MIPDTAVEAAALSIHRAHPFQSLSICRAVARAALEAALEAAAPHMLTGAQAVRFDDVEELANVFTAHPISLGPAPAKLMRGHAQEIAAAILAAGYRKATK